VDISARLIWLFEQAGWVSNVRWPRQERLARLTVAPVEDRDSELV
jgi:stearoyl-CoA desaturase (delta-9 desaturase)